MTSTASTLLEPRLSCRAGKGDDQFEASVHTLTKPLLREFRHVFGEVYLQAVSNSTMRGVNLELLAIPTNQNARLDLVAVGDDVEAEKDRLLNVVSSLTNHRPKPTFSLVCSALTTLV